MTVCEIIIAETNYGLLSYCRYLCWFTVDATFHSSSVSMD